MPTRVVLLQESTRTPAPIRRSAEVVANNAGRPQHDDPPAVRTPVASGSRPPPSAHRGASSSNRNTPYSFRKTIRSKGNNNHDSGEQEYEAAAAAPLNDDSSSSDVRSSPRMTSYINSLLCSSIMLISIVQFHQNENEKAVQYTDQEFFVSNYGVYLWKLRGAFGISSAGTAIYALILLAHFDTVCFPDFWTSFFQDGSKGERNLIYALIVFWMGGVYLCTSSLSVGSTQANVYFTSWIAFVTNVINYGVWRSCAGYRTWRDMLKSCPRETSYNWCFTLFFALVASLGASDSYANRDELSIYFAGQEVHEDDRMRGMIVAWASVVICIIVLIGNYFSNEAYSMTCCKFCELTLDWRQFEFAFLMVMLAMYGYTIFVFTGTTGIFNGPSNTYFGVWGTFFSAVVTLGTWIKENRNFFILRLLPSSPTTTTSSARARQSSRRRSTTS